MSDHQDLLHRFPLKVYTRTLLEDITTSHAILPGPHGTFNTPYHWPSALDQSERYLSLLPPSMLNLDRAARDAILRPVDGASLIVERDWKTTIYLTVHRGPDPQLEPRDKHWAIRWSVYTPFGVRWSRNLEITSENTKHGPTNYLINFGPTTTVHHLSSSHGMIVISLGELTLPERRLLEAIAWNAGVMQPDGEFNCQNWVAAVLFVAVARGLFNKEVVLAALTKALQDDLPEDEYVTILPE